MIGTTSEIVHYQIENDTYEPNKVINFTIGSMKKGDSVLLHFSCWVLVKNHDFSDLPSYVKIPKTYQLPDETKIWLVSNSMVQTHSVLLRDKARELHGLSDNLIRYARRIAPFLRYHHYFLFAFELHAGLLLSQRCENHVVTQRGECWSRPYGVCLLQNLSCPCTGPPGE